MLSNGPEPTVAASLSPAAKALLDRFDNLWQLQRPSVDDFLAASPEGEQIAVLIELVHADLTFRLGAGEPARVEDYLGRYPELASRPAVVADLLAAEFRLRRRRDPGHDPADYLRRFPEHAALIEGLAGVAADHQTLTHPASLDTRMSFGPVGAVPGGGGIPGYQVLGELGRGGMGVVYKARHLQLNRVVALKMVLGGGHAGPEEHARFLAEAEAAAALQHPNIVQVFDFGQHNGLPYMALEFVPGGSLNARLREGLPRPLEAAALVEQLARGMAVAHARGILHRDLKPHNVLLAPPTVPHACTQVRDLRACDGSADQASLARCTAKITDFGLAKRVTAEPGTDSPGGLTITGAVMGTPSYMAPEQARGQAKRVGPPADIYALGAILYECLTGRPPFRGPTQLDTLLQVTSAEPVPVRSLQPAVPRDLETICHKCLQKDPARRYASAEALAEDLSRLQAGEPVRARPVGRLERAWRWCRRNPVPAAAVALILATAAAAFVIITQSRNEAVRLAGANAELADSNRHLADKERQEKENARSLAQEKERLAQKNERLAQAEREQRKKAERDAAASTFQQGLAQCEQGDVSQGMLLLARGLELASRARATDLEHAIRANLAFWRTRVNGLRAVFPCDGEVLAVAFSPDGRQVLTGGADSTARVWDAVTGKSLGKPVRHEARLVDWSSQREAHVVAAAFSPDGRTVVTATGDPATRGKSQLWETMRMPGLHLPKPFRDPLMSGRLDLFTARTLPATLWEPATGKILSQPGPMGMAATLPVWSVAFSPDGKTILAGCGHWRKNDSGIGGVGGVGGIGRPFGSRPNPFGTPGVGIGDPFGNRGSSGFAGLWDVGGRQTARTSFPHDEAVLAAAFSPDGKRVLTGSADRTARLWDATTGKPMGQPLEHQGLVVAVAFSPDGRVAVTASNESLTRGVVKFWDAAAGTQIGGALVHRDVVSSVAFSPDGRTLVTGSGDPLSPRGEVRFYDVRTGREVGQPLVHRGFVQAVAFSPDGRTVLTGCADKTARLWEIATGNPVALVRGHDNTLAYSPDGRTALVGVGDKQARLCNTLTGEMIGKPFPFQESSPLAEFSPDGQHVLVGVAPAGQAASFQVLEAATGKAVGPAITTPESVRTAVFSADGRLVLTGTGAAYNYPQSKNEAQVWDVSTGKPRLTAPPRHKAPILAVAFSPDSKIVLTGSDDHTARLWDAGTGVQIGPPLTHEGPVRAVAFSPDGKHVLTGSDDRTGRLWDAATGKPIGRPLLHQGAVRKVAFSPRGAVVATGSDDYTARLWRAATGKAIGPALQHQGEVRALAFSQDGLSLATGAYDGTVRVHDAATGRPILAESLSHGGPVLTVAFGSGGRTVLTRTWEKGGTKLEVIAGKWERPIGGVWGSTGRTWSLPAVVAGEPEQVVLWVEAVTGKHLDPDGVVGVLDAPAWQERRQRLPELRVGRAGAEEVLGWHRREFQAAERRGQWFAAAWHLERLAQAEPGNWEHRARLGRACIELRRLDRALDELNRAIELRDEEWVSWFNRGVVQALRGEPDRAVADFSAATRRDPQNWEPWYERGLVHARREQWDKAGADLEKATSFQKPVPAAVWADYALVCLQLGNKEGFTRACGILRMSLARTENPQDLATAAWACSLAPYSEGVAALTNPIAEAAQRAAATDPRDYRLARSLGAALYRAGRFEAAVVQLSGAAALRKPAPATASFFLALAHHRLRHPEEAQQWLTRAEQWMEQARRKKPGETTEGDVLPWDQLPWSERLTLQILHREAVGLIRPAKP